MLSPLEKVWDLLDKTLQEVIDRYEQTGELPDIAPGDHFKDSFKTRSDELIQDR